MTTTDGDGDGVTVTCTVPVVGTTSDERGNDGVDVKSISSPLPTVTTVVSEGKKSSVGLTPKLSVII